MNGAVEIVRKVVVAGVSGVGKTSLLDTFMHGFWRAYTTGIPVVQSKIVRLPGVAFVKMQLWDTAGQERYLGMMPSMYFRGAHVCVLVFEQGSQKAVDALERWREQAASASDKISFVVVESKMDLSPPDAQRVREQARAFCEKNDIRAMFSVSSFAASGGLAELFNAVAELSIKGDILLHRKRRARQAVMTLRILWQKERKLANVSIGVDVFELLVKVIHNTERDECWGLPGSILQDSMK